MPLVCTMYLPFGLIAKSGFKRQTEKIVGLDVLHIQQVYFLFKHILQGYIIQKKEKKPTASEENPESELLT